MAFLLPSIYFGVTVREKARTRILLLRITNSTVFTNNACNSGKLESIGEWRNKLENIPTVQYYVVMARSEVDP